MSAAARQFLVSCEHGGNRIPAAYRQFFAGRDELLRSHRGYDAGAATLAADLAAELATDLAAPLLVATTSRLLIDLNRSLRHPHLYSEATRDAPPAVRREILERCYLPYRTQAESAVAQAVAQGARVIHIAAHSFTPELDGELRSADIGLLYDPARAGEVELCGRWQAALKALTPQFRVRRNYPYAGVADGLTAYLRRRFAADQYVGIELEINQKHVFKAGRPWRTLRASIVQALRTALADD